MNEEEKEERENVGGFLIPSVPGETPEQLVERLRTGTWVHLGPKGITILEGGIVE